MKKIILSIKSSVEFLLWKQIPLSVAAFIALGLVFAPFNPAQAALSGTTGWTGASGTDFFTPGNWTNGVPTSASPGEALFSGAAGVQPNLGASGTIGGLDFSTTTTTGYDITSSNTSVKLSLNATATTSGSQAICALNTTGSNIIDVALGVTGAQTFSQAGGGTLVINGLISGANTSISLTGGASTAQAIFTLTGSNTYSGKTTLNSYTTLNINSALAISSGSLSLASGASSATIDNTSGGSVVLSNNNNIALAASLTFAGSNNLSFGIGSVVILGASRTITTNGTATLTLNGTVSDGGSNYALTKAGAGVLALGGTNSFGGGVTVSGGTLIINNSTALGSGTLTITGAAVVDNASNAPVTLTNQVVVPTGGSLSFSTGAGTANNNLTFGGLSYSGPRVVTLNGSGALAFTGSLLQTNSAGGQILTVNNGTGTTSNSSVTFGGYTLSTTSTTAQTSGITGNANVNITGAVINGSSYANALTYSGSGTLALSGNNTYTGLTTMSGVGGTLTLSGNNSSASGGVALSAGRLNINNANALGSGTLNISGGTIDATNGSIVNAGNNALTFTTTGDFTFGGSNSLDLGTGTAALNISGGATRTITMNGAVASTLTLGNVIGVSSTNNPGSGTLMVNGAGHSLVIRSLVTNVDAVTARGFTINGSGNVTINGSVSGSNSANSLTYGGSGTLTLAGNSAYTGATTVTSGSLVISGSLTGTTQVTGTNGSTIQLNSNDVLNHAANFTLGGATLNTNTHNVTVAALTLAGPSIINFGSTAASVINFADSSAIAWSGSLTISNWNSSALATSGVNQIFFGNGSGTGLTTAQLGMIDFLDPTINGATLIGDYTAEILPTGEVVALSQVPEPATWVVLLSGVGVLVGFQRMRNIRVGTR